VQKTTTIEAPSRLPGSIIVCVGRECWRNALMVVVQAEPKWTKDIEVALVSIFDPQSRFVYVHAEKTPITKFSKWVCFQDHLTD
jgi:hypothetical protein